MKGRIAPPAVSLFIALLISPAVPQEGLFSLWVLWGVPLLSAALVFSVLSAIVLGPPRVVRIFSRAGSKKDDGESRDGNAGEAESAEAQQSADEIAVGPDAALADAMSELDPENYMDLARALEEMGRDADALEVLAHIVEARENEDAEELAEALRRMRQRLGPNNSESA
ncbi:MAG: hypothetical protein F4Y31_05650 [Gammaproteobacteria bacterium]|nr:hypothetical protein [Gammaproteobacteria bacterium]MYF66285.1 hypothetical protein [Gammaproteobacteria bacterium]MYK38292.1 hypothetical protein [Gammaproteobacteria bacterium]